MNAVGFVAVGVGAVFGAWLRWGLSVGLNTVLPNLPLGTLLCNLAGGLHHRRSGGVVHGASGAGTGNPPVCDYRFSR